MELVQIRTFDASDYIRGAYTGLGNFKQGVDEIFLLIDTQKAIYTFNG